MPAKGTKPKRVAKSKTAAKTSSSKKAAAATTTTVATTPEVVAEPAVVATPAVVVDATAVTNEPVSVSETLQSEFNELVTTLNGLKTVVSSLSTRLRTLQKKYDRELRTALKSGKKRRAQSANPNRKPSGFVKPTLITDELATFLNRESGAMMARTEVTREINKYIRENKLQDPNNGRVIHPDDALRSLLNVKKNEELTYFNLQKYMSPHFKKSAPSTA